MKAGECRRTLSSLLEKSGVIAPDFEADEIIRTVTGCRTVISGTELDEKLFGKMLVIAEKRIGGMPLQYIFGEWEFYGLPFKVGEGVLIPRPETELLAELAIKRLNKNGVLLDLCSGSGCIPIAAAKTTGCRALGVELYDGAMKYFSENIALSGADVSAVQGDVFSPPHELDGMKFDVITSNPPYLTSDEMETLQLEVRHEPSTALFGGVDGLDFYRRIFLLYKPFLKKNALFAVETGDGQAQAVAALMNEAGYSAEILCDYAKIPRVVYGTVL